MKGRATPQFVLIGLTLLALIVLLGFMALGTWQLERGRAKADLVEASAERVSATALGSQALAALLGAPPDASAEDRLRFRRVRLDGQWAGGQSILLDNRTERGVAGYHVYTPFHLTAGPIVLVDRGWRPWSLDRRIPTDTSIESKSATIAGNLAVPRQDVLVLGTAGYDDDAQAFPLVVQRLELDSLEARIGGPIVPMLVLLDSDAADGFERNWPAFLGISPQRHHGYAVQWFSLSATVAIVYVVLLIRYLRRPSSMSASKSD